MGPNGGAPIYPTPIIMPDGDNALRGKAYPLYPQRDCGGPYDEMAQAIARALFCVQLNTRQPASYQMPATGTPFIAASAVDIAVTDGAFVDVATIILENSEQKIAVKKLGMQLEASAAFNDVQWRFTFGGRVVPMFEDIRVQIGTLQDPDDVTILIGGKVGVLSLQAISLTVGAVHTARARFDGWIVNNSTDSIGNSPKAWVGD
jgi:hypothetical protein